MYSPLEQFQAYVFIPFRPLNLVDLSLSIPTLNQILLGSLLVMAFHMTLTSSTIKATLWNEAFISFYSGITQFIQTNLGTEGKQYFPVLATFIIYITVLNLAGLIPYTYAFTAQIIITMGLSVSIWIAITILAIKNHKWNVALLFVPNNAPLALIPMLMAIEILSYTARAISLGVRLAANITSGHILLAIISSFAIVPGLPLSVAVLLATFVLVLLWALTLLETGVAAVQAYVFCLLTTIYLNDAHHVH